MRSKSKAVLKSDLWKSRCVARKLFPFKLFSFAISYLSINGIIFKQLRQENNTFGTWREMRLCAAIVDARIYNARLKWKSQVRQKVYLTMRMHYRTRTKSKHVLPPRIFHATGRYILMITCVQHPNLCMKSKRSGTWMRKEVLYWDLNM